MKIFQSYTGNAMLNNALMTIEALGKLNNVSEITTDVLSNLYENNNLIETNKRLKSYTMLFTNNGPLYNDKKNGEKVYDSLFKTIIDFFENDGDKICEISGLRFSTPFETIYTEALKKIDFTDKDIKKKDITIHRGWFPLIGGLGSDAQALPQAKYAVRIHPICIAIMQFLPLSAFIYKGGILLIDSSNFEFARSFIAENVKIVISRIQNSPSDQPIENIKDFSKGNYLLRAIGILENKEMEDEYSDLNLWSFSNSGTGANCQIERVPNSLIKQLIRMNKNLKICAELKNILRKKDSSYSFLQALEGNKEWYLLYPNVFGSGKKKVVYDGVSVEFLETYFKEIGTHQYLGYAKYLAYLINKYKTEAFNEYLNKSDAHKDDNYKNDFYAVLIKAAEHGEWDLLHHIEILDDPELVPIKNNFYKIHKLTHFYLFKRKFQSELPKLLNNRNTQVQKICEWIIALVANDERKDSIKKDLLNAQNYFSVIYSHVFFRAAQKEESNLESILYACYDNSLRSKNGGLNSLLRIFFSQPKQELLTLKKLEIRDERYLNRSTEKWINKTKEFVQDYQDYYFYKYGNSETDTKPNTKFFNLVRSISMESSKFLIWFYEAIENTNIFLKENQNTVSDKWSETLLYDSNGQYNVTCVKFIIKFLLLKQHYSTLNTNSYTLQ